MPFPFSRPEKADEAFFRQRDVDVVYVGNPNASKVERLTRLKRHFGDRMRVHGRWPFKGYLGFVRGLLGKPFYPYRVTSLVPEERTQLYWRTKIGFNMHVSDQPYETGNMRMYEIPAHGMLMVCDKAAANSHASIFEPGTDAVYYRVFEYRDARPSYGWDTGILGTIERVRWTPEVREFLVHSAVGGRFVLHEQFSPSWQAIIDGRRAAVEHMGAFQAVQVPAGEHQVQFRFRSRGLRVGAWMSLASVLALVLLLVRRQNGRQEQDQP